MGTMRCFRLIRKIDQYTYCRYFLFSNYHLYEYCDGLRWIEVPTTNNINVDIPFAEEIAYRDFLLETAISNLQW